MTSAYISQKNIKDLTLGIFGVLFSYLLAGIVHQWMLKSFYISSFGLQDNFKSLVGVLIFISGTTWIIGAIVNKFTIENNQKTIIPKKNSILCASAVLISTLSYTYVLYVSSFPMVMMIKSCSLFSPMLISFFSNEKSKHIFFKNNTLFILTYLVGVFIFVGFNQQQLGFLKFCFLLISILADGFLIQFQLQIKAQHQPLAMEVMVATNQWVFFFAIFCSIIFQDSLYTFNFIYDHPLFGIHIFFIIILSIFGQIFVYRLIKQFSQRITVLLLSLRKILTVCLSIIIYDHRLNLVQFLGICIIFGVLLLEFRAQILVEKEQTTIQKQNQEKYQKNQKIQNVFPEETKQEERSLYQSEQISSLSQNLQAGSKNLNNNSQQVEGINQKDNFPSQVQKQNQKQQSQQIQIQSEQTHLTETFQ